MSFDSVFEMVPADCRQVQCIQIIRLVLQHGFYNQQALAIFALIKHGLSALKKILVPFSITLNLTSALNSEQVVLLSARTLQYLP